MQYVRNPTETRDFLAIRPNLLLTNTQIKFKCLKCASTQVAKTEELVEEIVGTLAFFQGVAVGGCGGGWGAGLKALRELSVFWILVFKGLQALRELAEFNLTGYPFLERPPVGLSRV